MQYNSLLVAAEEFSVLMPNYDMEYVGVLNSIFNNPGHHDEERRFNVKEVRIEAPQLNILGGVQPQFLGSNFPEEVWSTGLGRRFIMIYSSDAKERDPFIEDSAPKQAKEDLLKRLGELSQLQGPIKWTREALEPMRDWILGGKQPVPNHTKLQAYCKSREMFVMKLAGISSASRIPGKYLIELPDFERALRWMTQAETLMPDVFRAMVGKNDWQIIEELFHYLLAMWKRSGQKDIEGHLVYKFVAERATSDKVSRIIDLAVKSNVIVCINPLLDLWRPKPRYMQDKGT
jgi:hypothetical protein